MNTEQPTLLEHNRKTLRDIGSYIAAGKNCCVVNPCGSGKTSIMASFIRDHPGDTFLILTKQKNASTYYRQEDEIFCGNNVRIRTYNKMHSDVKGRNLKPYKADYYLVDEAHYVGASKWGVSFRELLNRWDPRLIGFTATPQRYEDQGTDHTIVEEFFGGNNAGNVTVAALEHEGVFVKPEYVLSIYNINTIVNRQIERVAESDLAENIKNTFYSQLLSLQTEWERDGKPSVILGKYLPEYMYKRKCNRILVYVSSLQEIPEKQTAVDKLIRDVFPNDSVKSYVYTYKTSESVLQEFLEEDETYIKVLYSINKIMETIHIQDLRICIMLRPSVSNRIITQQFGRINSIGNKNKPLIIDMVGNLEKLQDNPLWNGYYSSKRERDRSGSGSDIYLKLPHIAKAFDVFEKINDSLRSIKTYEYQGVKGSLSDLCFICNRNVAEVKELLKTYDMETAIEMARPLKCNISKDVLDSLNPIPEFVMSEENKKCAEEKFHLYENFIKRRDITDEDLCQDIYIMYCYSVKRCMESNNRHATSSIIKSLQEYYKRALRRKFLQHSLTENYDEANLVWDSREHYDSISLHKFIQDVIKTSYLSEKEMEVLSEYFGLEGDGGTTLKEIGESMNITRSRAQQIVAKALRKMRQAASQKCLHLYL